MEARAAAEAAGKIRQQVLNLADTLEREIDQTVEEVMLQAGRVAELTNALAIAANEMNTLVNEVRQSTDVTSSNVNSVAAATEELSASSQEIASQVADSARLTNEATESADDARAQVSALEEATTNISSVVDLINSIAAQTKLLALNATIEAARDDAGSAVDGRLRTLLLIPPTAMLSSLAVIDSAGGTRGVLLTSGIEALAESADRPTRLAAASAGDRTPFLLPLLLPLVVCAVTAGAGAGPPPGKGGSPPP